MRLRTLVVPVVLFAHAALAQVPPVVVSSEPYAPLAGGTPVAFTARGTNTTDEGWAELTLPFAFPYFGQSYTSVFVDVNGFLSVGAACSVGSFSSICYSNTSLPATSAPNGVIAGVWDDMELDPSTVVRSLVTASDVTVEWVNLKRYASNTTLVTFQIKLTASGTIFIHYGPLTGPGNDLNYSMGLESADGTQGLNLNAACINMCTNTHYVPERLYVIGEPNEADLVTTAVGVSNFIRLGDGNLTFDVSATLRNFGKTAASGVLWRAYLSTDRVLDVGDAQVAEGGPVSLPASNQVPDGGLAVVTVSAAAATTTAPGTGEYFVLVKADATDVVMEASETNNVGSTATSFVQGTDLVAQSVTPPATAAAGLGSVFSFGFTNRGATAAGATAFRLYLSADQVLDGADFPFFSDSRTVAAGQTISETLTVSMPANVPGGAFHVLLQVDPANAIAEASEGNNVVASTAKLTITRPDVVATGLQLLDPATGTSVSTARFGHPVRARVTLGNATGIDVSNFYVALVVSADATFSLLDDTWVCHQLVPSLPGTGAPLTVTLDCTLPLTSAAGAAFPTGPYHLLALADATGVVTELNEANNGASLGPTRLTAPGVDLVVASVVAPGGAGAGEAVPVERALRNVGEVGAAAARYRYVASRDPQVSADDQPLLLLPGGSSPTPGSVTLAAGASDVATDLVQLPASLAPGTWYLGCVVDSDGAVAEVEEDNNTRTSAAVTVVGAGLVVAGDQLPDAVLGRAYAFQLAARGALGPLSWSLVAGEGDLPAGLALATDGQLSGTPTAPGVFAFTVRVSDGATTTTARLALRVTSPLAPLEVTTTALPPVLAVGGLPYRATLAAVGGKPPYAWELTAGTLPAWLSLSTDGVLTGLPPSTLVAEVLRLTAAVTDSVGARASRELVLSLQPGPGLAVKTAWLSEAVVGQPWSQAVIVDTTDGMAVPTPLRFSLGGTLPAGVQLLGTPDSAVFQGTPVEAGSFSVSLLVEDARGRTASAAWVLRVHPARASVRASGLPTVVHPGDEVTFTLSLATNRASRFELVAGQLPPGLALAAEGTVSGRLAAEEPPGRWDFVVEGTDANGVSGLGAFTVLVEARPAGCSSAGGLLAPGALLLLLGLARRQRRSVASLAVAAVLAWAPQALAQGGAYQASAPTPVAFVPLVGASPVMPGSPLALPFTFDFGGTPVTGVVLSQFGYLALNGTTHTYSTNQNVPYTGSSTAVPRTFIAPWWDVLGGATAFGMQVRGVAPRRVATFEWRGALANSGTSRIDFQVELHETTGRVRFLYGAALPGMTSASVGLQRDFGVGVPGLPCASTASCTSTDYPAGQAIDFQLPAELQVDELSAPVTAYAGIGLPVAVKLGNRGGRDVANVTVRLFLSADATLDPGDTVLGQAVAATLPAMGEAVASAVLTVPAGAPQGSRWLLAQVDPDNLVPEREETNNVGQPFALTVGAPTANLRAASALGPAQGTPGGAVQVSRVIENVGSAAAAATRATWFLSTNAVVSVADRPLGSAVAVPTLAVLATDSASESVTLPADLVAGSYWLGVCANYDPAATPAFGVPETSLLDNCVASPVATVVSRGALTITTTSLPVAAARVPWAAWLSASGGVGGYAWSLGAGTLPPGLELTAGGQLRGTPWEAGTSSIEVRVTSGSETQTATLQLEVRDELPLTVVEQRLPAARSGQRYEVQLAATGGQAPWSWALSGSATLPPGLALAASGALSGRPTATGLFPFDVTVTDAAGVTAQGSLVLEVFPDEVLQFATRSLPPALLGQPWSEALEVTGGVPPYALRLVRYQELPLDATDAPGPALGDGTSVIVLPPELGLALEPVAGMAARIAGTPARAGRFALRFEVTDAKGASAPVELELLVTSAEPLVITTATLPDAEAGSAYAVQLEASVPGVEFALACTRNATSATTHECVPLEPLAQIPTGLGLATTGLIAGRAAAPTAGTETSTFLVKATAADGRRAVRALSLTVRVKEKQGCSAGGGLAAGWLAAALAVVARRRRGR